MGKLLNPGPGEVTDRLTILALKVLFGQQAGKDCTHWLTERSQLLPQLRGRALNGAWFEQTLELAAVNAALWHGEDDLRGIRAVQKESEINWVAAGIVGVRLQQLNDRRAELVAQINRLAGEKVDGEKI